MYRVVITDFLADDLAPERRIFGDLARVEALNVRGERELVGRIEDADAVLLYHTISVGAQTIARLKHCRLIVRCGVGVDNVAHAFAATRGIPVANIPDYGTEDVADTAIGMMLTLARGIHPLNAILRDGRGAAWSYAHAAPLRRLRGSVFATVGLGRIGSAAALRAKALGMDVVFYDPFKPDGYDKALGVRRAERIEDLFAQAYVLSLHCPLTEQTRHLVNARTLALLPRGAILVNTSRGEVVDAGAIPAALASGQLAGAGIDVLATEPPRGDEPILAAWRDPAHPAHHRLILNPHSAFYSEQGLMDMRTKGAEAVRRALLGEPIRNVVNGVGGSDRGCNREGAKTRR
jgi:D-3-phosphoglycerate dehydrogenase/C-terminal binding protein